MRVAVRMRAVAAYGGSCGVVPRRSSSSARRVSSLTSTGASKGGWGRLSGEGNGLTASLQGSLSRRGAAAGMAAAASSSSVPIAVGDSFPTDVSLSYFDSEGEMKTITTGEMTRGKKVVLFAVPGAFTPTCSLKHLPGFIEKSEAIKAKGVDTLACVSVNDVFVMDAWGKSLQADGKVMMAADGSAELAKALGVELDLNDKGLGVRSRRYVMLLDDGVVTLLNLEEGGAFTFSSADDILKNL